MDKNNVLIKYYTFSFKLYSIIIFSGKKTIREREE